MGVRRWEVGTIVTVVAKLSPLEVHFMGYTIRELFICATCHCELEIPRMMAALNRYPFASRREWQRGGGAKLHLGETVGFQGLE